MQSFIEMRALLCIALWLVVLGMQRQNAFVQFGGVRRLSSQLLQLNAMDDLNINGALQSPSDSLRSEVTKSAHAIMAGLCVVSSLNVVTAQRAEAAEVKGYKAVQSPYAPGKALYNPPLLPQSALINTLPVQNVLIGEIQAYIESFSQLLNPSLAQERQLQKNTSALWSNLRINAQRAAGMFLYNRAELLPVVDDSESKERQVERLKRANIAINTLQGDVLRLVNASRRSSVSDSLRCMRYALNTLSYVGYLSVPHKVLVNLHTKGVAAASSAYPQTSTRGDKRVAKGERVSQLDVSPSLVGRATVALEFKRGKGTFRNNVVRIVIDGIHHPLTAGNFVDLCKKGYYDGTPIESGILDLDGSGTLTLPRTLLGRKDGSGVDNKPYVNPANGLERRIPLEVLREDTEKGRNTVVGTARNAAVFTKAAPVMSFATYGAVGMFHPRGDGNGASTAFFVLPPEPSVSVIERDSLPQFQRLENRYSLFAYCIDGNDLLQLLTAGDVLASARVEPGLWELIPPKV